ncbi:MAG: DUF2974 domain-containing protein [Ruminococcus sp.]|nr:DUF2974 domain-containing protein [Ruminococcus sp.]
MAYSEKEMLAFSQIAYMDLEGMLNSNKARGKGDKLSLGDVVDKMERISKKSEQDRTPTEKHNLDVYNKIKGFGFEADDLRKWKISAIHNRNEPPNGNGFSCTVIETSPGEATVAFRGSDDFGDRFARIKDWGMADIALLLTTQTEQQKEADRFFSDPKTRRLLAGYDELAYTGHSLGGNLAEYSAIVSSKYGLDNKLKQTVSLDGPGFSNEFLKEHAAEIDRMSSKMKHIRWSFVGALLQDLPGVDYGFADVKGNPGSVSRHDCSYVKLDGDHTVKGEQDDFSKFASELTKEIDNMPKAVGGLTATVLIQAIKVEAFWESGTEAWLKTFGEGPLGIAKGILTAPAEIIFTAFTAVDLVITAIITIPVVWNSFTMVKELIELAAKGLEDFLKWSSDMVRAFKTICIKAFEDISNWWKSIVDAGYKYAQDNFVIRADTGKLREFADRAAYINRQLQEVRRITDSFVKIDYNSLVQIDYNSHRWDQLPGIYGNLVSDIESSLRKMADILETAERKVESLLQEG